VADIATLILQVEKEYDEIKEKTFWKLYMKKIDDERKRILNRCATSKDDARYYQGSFQAIEDLIEMPGRVLKELREKRVAPEGP